MDILIAPLPKLHDVCGKCSSCTGDSVCSASCNRFPQDDATPEEKATFFAEKVAREEEYR